MLIRPFFIPEQLSFTFLADATAAQPACPSIMPAGYRRHQGNRTPIEPQPRFWGYYLNAAHENSHSHQIRHRAVRTRIPVFRLQPPGARAGNGPACTRSRWRFLGILHRRGHDSGRGGDHLRETGAYCGIFAGFAAADIHRFHSFTGTYPGKTGSSRKPAERLRPHGRRHYHRQHCTGKEKQGGKLNYCPAFFDHIL